MQVILDDGTAHTAGRRRASFQATTLLNTVIAELGKGECVGEHSAILRGKCEASVRAKGSVELLVVPRETMLYIAQRNALVKHRLWLMMNTRFAENLYLTTGKMAISGAATAMRCMLKFVRLWRKRRAAREAANPPSTADGQHATNGPPAAAPGTSSSSNGQKSGFADDAMAA